MLKDQNRQIASRIAGGTATVLDDAPVWAEVQRAAQILTQHTRGGGSASTEACNVADDASVRRLTIAGEWYDVRSGMVAGPGAPVIVVVLERRVPDPTPPPTGEQTLRGFRFTASEARVARLLADRRSNREIAVELDVTEHTARRHTEKVMRKLRVNRRAEVEHALTGFHCAA